jgi:hypothetical protein
MSDIVSGNNELLLERPIIARGQQEIGACRIDTNTTNLVIGELVPFSFRLVFPKIKVSKTTRGIRYPYFVACRNSIHAAQKNITGRENLS